MGIALVSHIKDQPVTGKIKHPVKGHCDLYRAQVGGQMTAGFGDRVDQAGTEAGAKNTRSSVVIFFISGISAC